MLLEKERCHLAAPLATFSGINITPQELHEGSVYTAKAFVAFFFFFLVPPMPVCIEITQVGGWLGGWVGMYVCWLAGKKIGR